MAECSVVSSPGAKPVFVIDFESHAHIVSPVGVLLDGSTGLSAARDQVQQGPLEQMLMMCMAGFDCTLPHAGEQGAAPAHCL